ncbi:MAG: DUF2283 domain-containing protein [Thermoguttaceae bacterium]
MKHLVLRFDKEVNAAYLHVRQGGKVATTKQSTTDDDVLVDLDHDGVTLGIEILNVDSIESNKE